MIQDKTPKRRSEERSQFVGFFTSPKLKKLLFDRATAAGVSVSEEMNGLLEKHLLPPKKRAAAIPQEHREGIHG